MNEQTRLLKQELYELRRQKNAAHAVREQIEEAEHFTFQMTEDMGTPSGQATIWSMDQSELITTAAVMNTLDDFSHLKNQDWGVCFKTIDESTPKGDEVYWAIHPEGEGGASVATYFELTANLDREEGATAAAKVVVSTDPDLAVDDPITVINRGRHRAYTTARGWALKMDNNGNDEWWIVNVNQPAIHSVFQFLKNSHIWSGTGQGGGLAHRRPLDATVVGNWQSTSAYPNSWLPENVVNPSGDPPLSIQNPHNYIGRDGVTISLYTQKADKALCSWNDETQHFEIYEIFNGDTMRVRCRFTEYIEGIQDREVNSFYLKQTEFEIIEPTAGHHCGDLPDEPEQVLDPLNLTLNASFGDFFIMESRYREGDRDQGLAWYVVEVEKSPERFYEFELLGDVITNPVLVKILDPRSGVVVVHSALMYHNLNMFEDMKLGDKGICVASKDFFYAVNAPCPPPEPEGPVFPTP